MKTFLIKLLTGITAFTMAISLIGCNDNSNNQNSSQTETQPTTAAEETTAPAGSDQEFDISELHAPDENGDAISGIWRITDGEGSQYSSFDFIFNGNGKAVLAIDNYGFCSNYSLSDSSFSCNLMYGINGSYSYKVSDDKNKIVLTSDDSGKTTTLERKENSNILPEQPENYSVNDDNLIGAWASDTGEYFYFDESGIMYHNQFGALFNFATFTTEDNKIKTVYKMNEEVTEDFDYSIDGDVLTLSGYEYKRTTTDNLKEFLSK